MIIMVIIATVKGSFKLVIAIVREEKKNYRIFLNMDWVTSAAWTVSYCRKDKEEEVEERKV